MNNITILMIDNDLDRRDDLLATLARVNGVAPEPVWFSSLADARVHLHRQVQQQAPLLLLAHLGNLKNEGEPDGEFLDWILAQMPQALVVLYSGGGIRLAQQGAEWLLQQQHHTWRCRTAHPDRMTVVTRPVNGSSDLNLYDALRKYARERNVERLFIELQQRRPAELLLYSLAMCCQGYLLTRAFRFEGCPENCCGVLQETLQAMGWQETRQRRIRETHAAGAGRETLAGIFAGSQCWLDLFENRHLYQITPEARSELLLEQFHRVWIHPEFPEIPAEIERFIELLSRFQDIPQSEVLALYQQLSRRLAREPYPVEQLSEINRQRAYLNHDWLKNRYLNSLRAFVARLQARADPKLLQLFLAEDLGTWETHREPLTKLIADLPAQMSPALLFRQSPLSRRCALRVWLEAALVDLWKCRRDIDALTEEMQTGYRQADRQYVQLTKRLAAKEKEAETVHKLPAMRRQFESFLTTCNQLAETLSRFPREVHIV